MVDETTIAASQAWPASGSVYADEERTTQAQASSNSETNLILALPGLVLGVIGTVMNALLLFVLVIYKVYASSMSSFNTLIPVLFLGNLYL